MSSNGQGQQRPPWTDCVAHPMAPDSDCEFCDAELAAKRAYFQQQMQRAEQLDAQLASMVGMSFLGGATAPVMAKVNTLAKIVLGNNERAMVAWEVNSLNETINAMQEAMTEIRQQMIANGPNGQGGLIVPTIRPTRHPKG